MSDPPTCRRTSLIDGLAVYSCPSRTEREPHVVCVCLLTGRTDCTCKDFACRRRPRAKRLGQRIDIGTPLHQCQHIKMAVTDCIKRREIRLAA